MSKTLITLKTNSVYLLDILTRLEPCIQFSLKNDEETGIALLIRREFVTCELKFH